jgi:vancomycin permeability regulator SanA
MMSLALLPAYFLGTTWYQVNFYDDQWQQEPAANCLMILGSKVLSDNRPDLMMRERVGTALEVISDDIDTIIVTGGSVDNRKTESEVAKGLLIEAGVSEDRIETEQRSTSTYQNLLYSKHIFEDRKCESLDIVTHGFHLARAKFTAERLGYPVNRMIEAELLRENPPRLLQREYFAYMAYWLLWDWLEE